MRHLSERELNTIREKAVDAAKLLGPYTGASSVFHKFDDDCIVRIRVSQSTTNDMYHLMKQAEKALEDDQ
jgi:hypothetical protein